MRAGRVAAHGQDGLAGLAIDLQEARAAWSVRQNMRVSPAVADWLRRRMRRIALARPVRAVVVERDIMG